MLWHAKVVGSATDRKYTEAPRHGLQSKEEINAKFMAQVEYSKTVTSKNAEKLLKQLEKLEEVDNVNKIVKLLVA